MEKPHIRKPYDRVRSTTDLTGQESKTDRSFGNDTNINNIVARFARTGIMPQPTQEPFYGDVTALQGDLTEIMQKGEEAKKELENLQNQQIKQNKQQAEENKSELERLKALEQKIIAEQTDTTSNEQ